MTYSIHPLFVHFPIALLFLYSIIKIIPFPKYFPEVSWKHIERVLLFCGIIGALVASSTGEVAQELTSPNHQIVEAHELFANMTVWFYGLLLAGEILTMFLPRFGNLLPVLIIKILNFCQKILTDNLFSKTLAFVALLAISITGLLGGVMVYGVSADPVAPFVLQILGISF